eukprot:TRINITY_DN5742_c0_g1_i1.p1 TRINITY_DN5742_c0_g1~~TRINITY_DN5742_c0_g1_i1.p1  ORF type:complete len:123 (-),score=9.10 TRINITY_DN5742_c0_g1_i1:12-380(-)
MKANSRGMDWKKRYCILLEDRIQYFKVQGDTQCAGEIFLYSSTRLIHRKTSSDQRQIRSNTILSSGNSFSKSEQTTFEIIPTADEGERKYRFRTDLEDMDDWKNLIQEIVERKPKKVHSTFI